jgi:hypothetical protein
MKRSLNFGQSRGNPLGGTATLDGNPSSMLFRPQSQFQRARLTGASGVPMLATRKLLESSPQ